MASKFQNRSRGISLIEALIVASILSLFFSGLFAGIVYSIELLGTAKAKMTALSIATDQMEYIRSLSYDAVGTVAGIPAGAIPQMGTTTKNNLTFSVRTLIAYVDSPADGVGAGDANLITTDYKQAKITVAWGPSATESVSLQTNIIPRSIETNVGGGTLRVNVFDATVNPLPGASVRLVNNYLVPNIDITRSTDATGAVLFGGAPAGSEYEIYVSGTGYTGDQTYRATTSLPFPSVLPVSVVAADISTMNFFIDRTSRIDAKVYTDRTATSTIHTWSALGDFATSTEISVAGGVLQLAQTAGVYAGNGEALYALLPGTIARWDSVSVVTTKPAGTDVRVRFYTGTSSPVLVPETDLPGNAAGFAASTIDLSELSGVSYPDLLVGMALETASGAVTPTVANLTLAYLETETLAGALPITLQGTKTIGTNASAAPIFKHSYAATLSGGAHTFDPVEWDTYTAAVSGYDITAACPSNPFALSPNETLPLLLTVGANTANSLLVSARESDGTPVSGATITISRSGFSDSVVTDTCGSAYFGGVSADVYTISATATGYSSITVPDITVAGDATYIVEW